MQPEKAQYMSALSSSPTWRSFLRYITFAGALCIFLLAVQSHAQTARNAIAEDSVSNSLHAKPPAATEDKAIRPFRVKIPEEALVDLRRRLASTRWPDQETVTDRSQGVQLATMKELARYWQTDYDWRKVDVRRRSRKVADERRRAGQHHAILADEHRNLVSAVVLGERRTKRD
jgi:hypothetical protein